MDTETAKATTAMVKAFGSSPVIFTSPIGGNFGLGNLQYQYKHKSTVNVCHM